MKKIQLVVSVPDFKIPLFLVIVVCFFLWKFNFQSALFVGIFGAFLYYRWDTRILAGFAIVLLLAAFCIVWFKQGFEYGVTPSTVDETIIESYEFAVHIVDNLSIYAFYFFVINVILQIFECCNKLDFRKTKSRISSAKKLK